MEEEKKNRSEENFWRDKRNVILSETASGFLVLVSLAQPQLFITLSKSSISSLQAFYLFI
jgi:hypothetical protein